MGAMEQYEAFVGGNRLGRHAASSQKHSKFQSIGANMGKALWISLAVVFIILAIGFTIKVWPKGAPVENKDSNNASQAVKVDKKEIIEAYGKGDFKAVIPSLEKYLSRNPDDQEMREILASSYLLTGDKKHAFKEYEAILEAKPNDPETLYKIGIVLQHMDRTNEAITYLVRATQAAPNVILFRSELARANTKAKYYAEAIEEWKIVLNLLPAADKARASIFAEIANVYILQNEFLQAKEAIANGLALDPTNEALKTLEAKIGGQIQPAPPPGPGVGTGEN